MFYIERMRTDGWEELTGKRHTSAEYAKSELKKLYVRREISITPSAYRIAGDDGLVYFTCTGITDTHRIKWRWVPRGYKS